MRKLYLTMLMLLLIIPLPPAIASGAGGVYVGGSLGYETVFDAEVRETESNSVAELHGGMNLGFVYGYGLGNIRLEGELVWVRLLYDDLKCS